MREVKGGNEVLAEARSDFLPLIIALTFHQRIQSILEGVPSPESKVVPSYHQCAWLLPRSAWCVLQLWQHLPLLPLDAASKPHSRFPFWEDHTKTVLLLPSGPLLALLMPRCPLLPAVFSSLQYPVLWWSLQVGRFDLGEHHRRMESIVKVRNTAREEAARYLSYQLRGSTICFCILWLQLGRDAGHDGKCASWTNNQFQTEGMIWVDIFLLAFSVDSM